MGVGYIRSQGFERSLLVVPLASGQNGTPRLIRPASAAMLVISAVLMSAVAGP
jgi:hypothetical protein